MPEIFDEQNMRGALEKYIPAGETLLAGIHAIAKEMETRNIYGKCTIAEDRLIPDGDGMGTEVIKKKYAGCDIYLGITQYSLVIVECERERHLYEFVDAEGAIEAQELTEEILLEDIGKCFRLSDIADCKMKKGILGSIKCHITMKNGGYFKLLLPALGGLGGGMPHHAQYRDAIVAELKSKEKER